MELQLVEKIINEQKDKISLGDLKKSKLPIFSEITGVKSQITLLNLKIEETLKKLRFDKVNDKIKLLEMDYENKLFLDCIKVFVYNMENRMCEILYGSYEEKKEVFLA